MTGSTPIVSASSDHQLLGRLLERLEQLATMNEEEAPIPVEELRVGLTLLARYTSSLHRWGPGDHELTRERAESLARNIDRANVPGLQVLSAYREAIKSLVSYDLRVQWDEDHGKPSKRDSVHPSDTTSGVLAKEIEAFVTRPLPVLEEFVDIVCSHPRCQNRSRISLLRAPHSCYSLRAPPHGWTLCERKIEIRQGELLLPLQYFCPAHSPEDLEDHPAVCAMPSTPLMT